MLENFYKGTSFAIRERRQERYKSTDLNIEYNNFRGECNQS